MEILIAIAMLVLSAHPVRRATLRQVRRVAAAIRSVFRQVARLVMALCLPAGGAILERDSDGSVWLVIKPVKARTPRRRNG